MHRINVSYIEEVCGKDKEIITEMVNIFREQMPELAGEMWELYRNKDYFNLGLIAHKAKSSVAIMGMEDMAIKLKDLELKAKAGEDEDLYEGYIKEFVSQGKEAVSELDDYLAELD